jgi:hypothetical protein
MTRDLSLFRAIPQPRGCGERKAGGVYVESGVGPYGSPLSSFLIDPPHPLPAGLDLINKPQILPREWLSGRPVQDETGQVIHDLLIHVGAEHYPWAPDYIEETRRLGASRRLSPNLNFALLTRASHMLLAHRSAIPMNWQDLLPPDRCKKHIQWHDLASYTESSQDPHADPHRRGPCLFKLWELIPEAQANAVTPMPGQRPLCLRLVGSTMYPYQPTGEQVKAWSEGFVLCLPITGFSLIQDADGNVNSQAKEKLLSAQAQQGDLGLPFYEVPR